MSLDLEQRATALKGVLGARLEPQAETKAEKEEVRDAVNVEVGSCMCLEHVCACGPAPHALDL